VDVGDAKPHQVNAPQLAVDRRIESQGRERAFVLHQN
jgi:hypothetical protein